MFRKIFIILSVLICVSNNGFSEQWPIYPFNQQHKINGTFGECRSKTVNDTLFQRHYMHDGLDIDAPEGNLVYATIRGWVDEVGDNYVRTRHINIDWETFYTEYWHLKDIEVEVGDAITAGTTLLGKTDSLRHVHYICGKSGGTVENPLLLYESNHF